MTGSCVVVGAGPGLGLAIAARFASEGLPVGLIARDAARLRAAAEDLGDGRAPVAVAAADASDPGALAAALGELRERLGPAGVLVYNVAVAPPGTPSQLGTASLAAALAANVTGALAAVQASLPDLRAAGGAALLTGGGAALYPSAAWASLSVTKSALRALALVLHEELAPQGVRVSTITIKGVIGGSPGFAPDRIAERFWEVAGSAAPPAEVEYDG